MQSRCANVRKRGGVLFEDWTKIRFQLRPRVLIWHSEVLRGKIPICVDAAARALPPVQAADACVMTLGPRRFCASLAHLAAMQADPVRESREFRSQGLVLIAVLRVLSAHPLCQKARIIDGSINTSQVKSRQAHLTFFFFLRLLKSNLSQFV